MLTEAKNQFKVLFLTIKYALMREMVNKASFVSSIVFMLLNNATFIIEWIILFSLKDNFGGFELKDVLLLWGIASGTYGVSHFFFKNCFNLAETINTGKLDSYIVQPKNVLLSVITSSVEPSAIGDMIYAYIMLFIYGFNITNFLLVTLFMFTGGIIMVCIAVIFGSLSFWFQKSDTVADTANSLMGNFATYPDTIFKKGVKILLYTLVPVGLSTYLPVHIIRDFNIHGFLIIIASTLLLVSLSFIIFNLGLKRYSSSNLMIAKI